MGLQERCFLDYNKKIMMYCKISGNSCTDDDRDRNTGL